VSSHDGIAVGSAFPSVTVADMWPALACDEATRIRRRAQFVSAASIGQKKSRPSRDFYARVPRVSHRRAHPAAQALSVIRDGLDFERI